MNSIVYLGLPQYVKEKITRSIRRTKMLNESHPEYIIEKCCEYYGISVKQLKSTVRLRPIVIVRHICIYAIKLYMPEITYVKIGKIFNRDHATVIYSISSVKNLIETDKIYKRDLDAFIKTI